MGFFDISTDELLEEAKQFDSTGELYPAGVYEMVINNIYLDKSSGGTEYFAVDLTNTKDNRKLSLSNFSVERMVKNKEGSTKMSNGRYFTGVILLDKTAQIAGKNINQLSPVELNVEVFGEAKKVKVFKELINTKIVIGIRDVISEWNDKTYVNKEIVNILKPSDKENINKLTKKIEKNPVKDTTKQKKKSKNDNIDINPDVIPF